MTDVQIRAVTPADDFDAQLDLGQRAFGIYSAGQRDTFLRTGRLRAAQGLFMGAFAGAAPVGAAILHDLRQYWGGRPVGCAGVASVKVAPEHRGGGIGRRLMTETLRLAADRGYPLAALYPATMPIYRSLGWELAGGYHQLEIPGRSLLPLLAPDAETGAAGPGQAAPEVRRVVPGDAARVIAVMGAAHAAAADSGPVTWDEVPSEGWLGQPERYAYLAGDEGFAAYRWRGEGTRELFVERVHATTPGALRALWSVIASHSSTAATVTAVTAPDGPVWWLTREREARLTRREMWMLRVIDAPAAVAARGFPAGLSVSVPLSVSDRACPGNAGSWRLMIDGGSGQLLPDEDGPAPDALTVGPRGLAALYAGVPVATLRQAGLAAGGTPGRDAALTAAFAASPYMLDDF